MSRKTRHGQAKNAGHPTRRVRYAVAMSLDGFFAGPRGEADSILMDPEDPESDSNAWNEFYSQAVNSPPARALPR